jgi:acetoin utilization protein AcuB
VLNKDLISSSIPPLSLTDRVYVALQLMTDNHLSQLPVVSEDHYHGLVTEDQLLNAENDQDTLESLQREMSHLSINGNLHFSEAIKMMNEFSLAVLPVVDGENLWVGAIAASDLLKFAGKMYGTEDPGGIIVLELEKKEFSFSEISKLVETNDASVTQLNTHFDNNLGVLFVTLKINKFEISDIISTFQRYDYSVKYYFGEEQYENELKSNYDHLMNYLNI